MKFTLHYFDGLLEVKTFGEAECVKFREILESMVNHEKWNLGTPFLINHSNLNSGNLTVTDIQSIAEFNSLYKDKIGHSKCAHLVSRDLEYGMVRMWEVYVEGKWYVTNKLFRSRDEAVKWLHG